MKTISILTLLCCFGICCTYADENKTAEAIKKAIQKEKRYAMEQRFYSGDEYDLKDAEVDPESLKDIPLIVPDYDFDMSTGVYDD